jgi:deoxyribonuclease V
MLDELPDLEAELALLMAQVPRGRVVTCGDLARALGDVAASRWVGRVAVRHAHTETCPCHRVVRSDGSLTASTMADQQWKAGRLRDEGVVVHRGRVSLVQYGVVGLQSSTPLRPLKELQEELARRVLLASPSHSVPGLGGVDVSYVPGTSRAVAAYAEVERDSLRLTWSTTVQRDIDFPYIPSYLAYREVPILLDLIRNVARRRELAGVILVDGSGVLHPRQSGLATMLGVLLDWPTIGVTKSHLAGSWQAAQLSVGPCAWVQVDGRRLGAALRSPRSRKPLFVSPGHRIDVPAAVHLVRGVLRDRRLPEPLYWADRLSRQAARASVVHGSSV